MAIFEAKRLVVMAYLNRLYRKLVRHNAKSIENIKEITIPMLLNKFSWGSIATIGVWYQPHHPSMILAEESCSLKQQNNNPGELSISTRYPKARGMAREQEKLTIVFIEVIENLKDLNSHKDYGSCAWSQVCIDDDQYGDQKPKQLPIMLIMIAEVAAGNATAGEEKWEAAKTTPKAEFCMPSCKGSTET
ncbi:hypothetical protein H5410_031762 [Solanum commersonii]|uniref:Uncharacterized protein n=1 Tax=Solanum commersonii TaxID=4109 RepID=A0A9J5YL25_SOLCO|nr:hypothetical protein H5410_031762 [Solanum commersonii]